MHATHIATASCDMSLIYELDTEEDTISTSQYSKPMK